MSEQRLDDICTKLDKMDGKIDHITDRMSCANIQAAAEKVRLESHQKECNRRHSTLNKILIGIGLAFAGAIATALMGALSNG